MEATPTAMTTAAPPDGSEKKAKLKELNKTKNDKKQIVVTETKKEG